MEIGEEMGSMASLLTFLREMFSPKALAEHLVMNLVLMAVGTAGAVILGWLASLPPWAVVSFGIALFLVMLAGGIAWRRRRPKARAGGVEGWDTRVSEYVPHGKMETLLLYLFTPNNQPSAQTVRCELEYLDEHALYLPKPTHTGTLWEERLLEPGDTPHYSVTFPWAFEQPPNPIPNGEYELRWHEAVGVGERLLRWHRFEVTAGRLVVNQAGVGS